MAKRKSRVQGLGVVSDKKWQTDSDLRTLVDACAIRKDKARLKAAQELAKEKVGEMAIIAGDKGEY